VATAAARQILRVACVASLLAGAAVACSAKHGDDPQVPVQTCGLRVWYKPSSAAARVEIVGDWDGWKRPGIVPDVAADGWRAAIVPASPGEHAYAIVEDGVWLTDPAQPMTDTHDGQEVTVASSVDCTKPALRVDGVDTSVGGDATVHATFLSARGAVPVDPASIVVTPRNPTDPALRVASVDPAVGTITLAASALKRGKYTYTVTAKDAAGVVADDARATVWIDATAGSSEPWDPRDAIVYQIMIDRYRSAAGPLAAPATPAARAGGTLAGVRAALDSGEIQSLGVTALWLSPLYTNPSEDFPGADGHQYSSYHGYWPTAHGIDGRFASEGELDAFVADAHARGVRVLFDVVPNHVHQEHPWTKEHPDWFKPDCVCGQGSCDWATHIMTCWFAPYLPDLDWTNPDAAHAMANDVLWWFDRWDADGIRIDAVPMMPRSATRRIAATARQRWAHPGHNLYVLGENFTGPTGYQSLRYDLGPYGLDGAFHFPLMWSIRQAIALEQAPLAAVEQSYRQGEAAWAGSNAVMGLMIGNHDVARFASVSAGNDGGDSWTSPAQPVDPTVYAKQALALSAVLTFPGAPVIFYGDEVGLAGRSDPDCRRVMPGEDQLSDAQRTTRALARRIGRARACSRALRRGGFVTLFADAERLVFSRPIDGETAIVALTRRPTAAAKVTLPPEASASMVDITTGERVDLSSGVLTTSADAFAVHVYLPADSVCAGASLDKATAPNP
jgi:glycosidase